MQEFNTEEQFWIPYTLRFDFDTDELLCKWMDLGNKAFVEPFFDETLTKCKSLASNSKSFLSFTSPDFFADSSQSITSVTPTAFIFHISRCGSTLLSQLLGLKQNHITLSEVPFFDELLRLRYKPYFINQDYKHYLKSAIKLYGQKRTGYETELFIKMDSWHIAFWEELRELYPKVPFILLYRSPAEVIESHQKLRGMQAVPDVIEPEVFGLTKDKIQGITLDNYLACVLESYFETFLNIARNDPYSSLLNYNEGSIVMMRKISKVTNLHFTEEEWNLIEERSKFNAKFPGQVFSEERRGNISPEYLNKVNHLYQETEFIRLNNAV